MATGKRKSATLSRNTKRLKSASASSGRSVRWLDSYHIVSAWMKKYDIRELLRRGGGLVKIENFFPDFVADHILSAVEAIVDDSWLVTAAIEDLSENNITHCFWSNKTASSLQPVYRALALLLPNSLNTFSAARYNETHHIAPHDDRAYTEVLMDDGTVIQCSRDIAVIYYLTKDWDKEHGGALVDCQTGERYVPSFNSAVIFQVPRYHEVTEVTSERPRYSIFGWFLSPGKLYDLYTMEDPEPLLEPQPPPALDKSNPGLAAPDAGDVPASLSNAANGGASSPLQHKRAKAFIHRRPARKAGGKARVSGRKKHA